MIRCVTGYIIQAMQKSRFSFKNEQNFPIHTKKKLDMYTTSVDDRTEPNLPNTEASVRYYSVRFGSVGYRNTEPNLWGIF